MNDQHLEIVNQHQDVGPPVGSSNTNVVQLAVEPKAHFAKLVNAVSSHTRLGIAVSVSRACLRSSCRGNRRCGPMLKRRMWTNLVGEVSKLIEQHLEFVERRGGG